MKLVPFVATCAAVAVLAQPALAWTNEDHELFDIVSALETAEGKGTNFYSFLNTTKSATDKEINKAYRKRSLELHPDKNPNDKKIEDRFARLGLITSILRDAEKRKRYDFFYENGVPKWRGTGYYYSRYRPGLGSVITGLFIFSLFVQYLFLYLTARVQKMRIAAFRHQALEAAWGPTKKPQAGQPQGKKKLKVKTGEQGDPLGIPGINGGKAIGAGSTIEMMIDNEKVFIVENKKETLLTEDLAVKPTWQDTWLPSYIIPRYFPAFSSKRTGNKKRKTLVPNKPPAGSFGGGATSGSSGEEEEVEEGGEVKKVKVPKGPGRGVIGDGKVGGRRRKTIPRPSTPTTGAKKD